MSQHHKQNFLCAKKESYLTFWANLPDELRSDSLVNYIFDEVDKLDSQVRDLGSEPSYPFGDMLKKSEKYREQFIVIFKDD